MKRQDSDRDQLLRWDGGLDELGEIIGICVGEEAVGKQWCEYGADEVHVRKRADSTSRGETGKSVQEASIAQVDEKLMVTESISSQNGCQHVGDGEESA